MKRTVATLLIAALAMLSSGCASLNNPFRSARAPKTPAQAEKMADGAEEHLAEGRTAEALDDLRLARSLRGLDPELRARIDRLTVTSADRRLAELADAGAEPRELEALFLLNLPRQVKVTAGIRAAALYRDRGDHKKAYKAIQRVDTAYPPAGTHHERAAAGRILAESGLEQIQKTGSFLGFFRAADHGKAMLEYLVLNYPTERRCDEGYFALATRYEKERRWVLARERYEDLLRYHPTSPLAVRAQARIPHMRLVALRSPEYDRRELLRADAELREWLNGRSESAPEELLARVRLDLADCLERLVENDLSVARFYRRIDRGIGARFHAQRALETARNAGNERAIRRAESVLASVAVEPGSNSASSESAPESPPGAAPESGTEAGSAP